MSKEEHFPLITGRLSIDLVNTEVVRRGVRHDLLTSGNHALLWIESMQKNGFLTEGQINSQLPARLDHVLSALRSLRSFLRDKFEAIADQQHRPDDWHLYLEDLIAKAPLSYKVSTGKLIAVPVGTPEDALRSLIALDALDLLSTGELMTLRRCDNPDCVLLFMDKSGRRKWCSMKICGNRVKVARHQRKRDRDSESV
jgi:predicted RNA-binding Zn ribbon-like protein